MTTALLILDARILALLLPPALLGTCNFRLSTRKPTDVGDGPITPETPVKTANGKFPSVPHTLELYLTPGSESLRNTTPPSSRRSRKLFHIHDDDESKLAPLVISCNL